MIKLMVRCKNFILILCIAGFLPVHALALQNEFSFSTQKQAERFAKLTEETRCLVCQNQTLSDSHAPLAEDLRKKIAEMINDGKSDAQIKNFLMARYGEFVMYRPEFSVKTALLWLGPFMLLIVCGGALSILIRKQVSKK